MPDTIKSKLKLVGSGARVAHSGSPPHPDMVWIPGGTFDMGSRRSLPGGAPGPPGCAWTASGSIATRSPTRSSAASSSHGTRHLRGDPARPRRATRARSPHMLYRVAGVRPRRRRASRPRATSGTGGRSCAAPTGSPTGPQARSAGASDHPVVHVTFGDVEACARWAGQGARRPRPSGSSPRAAGSTAPSTPGATSSRPSGRHMANTWQGEFPWQNLIARRLRAARRRWTAFPPERLRRSTT